MHMESDVAGKVMTAGNDVASLEYIHFETLCPPIKD